LGFFYLKFGGLKMKIIHVENVILNLEKVSAIVEDYSARKSLIIVEGGKTIELSNSSIGTVTKAFRAFHELQENERLIGGFPANHVINLLEGKLSANRKGDSMFVHVPGFQFGESPKFDAEGWPTKDDDK
jgi:hypothetical protein